MKINKSLLAVGLVLLTSTWGSAADWNRFRGPDGTGISPDGKPPVTWSDAEHLAWKTALPGPAMEPRNAASVQRLGELTFV